MTEIDVLIVGAGFAGIGMGIQLARRGQESFVIIEQADDVGGTWRDNRYPGVACDIPAHLYSFSFRPNPRWSRVFAEGAEIHAYLRSCVRNEGLEPHLLQNCALERAQWRESDRRWHVRTSRGEFSAANLVIATGRLTEPRIPAVENLANFSGRHWHSARWNPKVSLVGKRVGLVGTGASAIQILPRLAGEASEVVVFQRSAPYVLPRGDRFYSSDELSRFAANPQAITALRDELFAEAERSIAARKRRHPEIDLLQQRALDHLASQVRDPELRRRLTPDYEIGCKRILFSDDYYAALQQDHVRLEPTALTRVEGETTFAAGGATDRVEVLVFATGFNATRPSIAKHIYGRGALPLAERWSNGMVAHATTAVDGFPNMYVLDGPNAALGHNSAIYVIETQIDYVLSALDHLAATSAGVLEVTPEAVQASMRDVDEMARDTVWTRGNCTSWYRDEQTGRVTLLWPDSAASFRRRNGTFDINAYTAL
ncbi:cation diffusion facilitator CzcD-associated flavoprotein CzcO [Nocardia transvalensis]|uniref:Cation diffusion facilitator CzcD-associated flavoprotein CzcO n=1 Tax=Nocardia transvalensis TaxID=37333 RepID=A0A7W9PGG3_9NOCA|nr:NAD(P)/FAD-dependent oxidoreductase [Nocardia transvalensis]MBB5915173.1 cation diffusion facilitator CzcD-associated flavoprotein CzcO [Nocardia transvalensis]